MQFRSWFRVGIVLVFIHVFVGNLSGQVFVKGNVIDNQDSLIFGNVLILSESDSSLINGSFFTDGNLEVKVQNPESSLIKLTAVGFNDTIFKLGRISGPNYNLGSIKMTFEVMIGVDIVYYKPMFEPAKNGDVQVNVKETMLASSASIIELLTKTPNVMVSGSSVSVIGKGEALLYLDGIQINFERLATIPVSRIEHIEVLTSPSAKYDAQGKAVINIVLFNDGSEGWQTMLSHVSSLGRNYNSNSNVGVNFRKNKWSLSADLGMINGKDWFEAEGTRTMEDGLNIYKSTYGIEDNKRFKLVSNYRAGISYQINENNDLSLEYAGFYNQYQEDNLAVNSIVDSSTELASLNAHNTGQTDQLNNAISLNYYRNIDSLGSALFVGGQYIGFQDSRNDDISESIITSIGNSRSLRRNIGRNNISLLTSQVDYVKNTTKGMSFDLGAKFSSSGNNGKIDFYSKLGDEEAYGLIESFSNDFKYTENNYAVYAQMSGKIKEKYDYVLGVRGELTDAMGISNVMDTTFIDTTYLLPFPIASVNIPLSESWNLAVNYAARVGRPLYQDLDPFVWYMDSLTSAQGNPALLPEYSNSFEATITRNMVSLKLGFSYANNASRIATLTGNKGPGSLALVPVNVEKVNSYYATLAMPFEYKFWSSYSTVSFAMDQLIDSRPELNVKSATPQIYAYSYNEFRVKEWFNLELSGDYIGGTSDGVYSWKPTYTVTAGLSKSFLDGALLCRFMANDIFKSYFFGGEYMIGNTTVDFKNYMNTHFYRIAVVFNIGKLGKVIYRNKQTGEEELYRIKT